MLKKGLTLLLLTTIISCSSTGTNSKHVKVYLRGIKAANIALIQLTGKKAYHPIAVYEHVASGKHVTFEIDRQLLPADFQLQFNYQHPITGQQTGSELTIIVNKNDVEVIVNPMFINIKDSVIFDKSDTENIVYQQFKQQNKHIADNIGLLRNVLSEYDRRNSLFYIETIKEYKQRLNQHSKWIDSLINKHNKLFVSRTFALQKIAAIDFLNAPKIWKEDMLDRYVKLIDYRDTLLTRTSDYRKWLDNYVNLHFEPGFSMHQIDSALTAAGKRIIDQARNGNSAVYGKMVDYFFEGYESMGLKQGIVMLERYVGDSNCKATKKEMIIARIKAIETLTIGVQAPDFKIIDTENKTVQFSRFGGAKPYKLLLIWSADCANCQDITKQLYHFYTYSQVSSELDVIAISIDDTETEISIWEQSIKKLPNWTHAISRGGVLSPIAKLYCTVSTPMLFIVETRTGQIAAIPETIDEVIMFFHK